MLGIPPFELPFAIAIGWMAVLALAAATFADADADADADGPLLAQGFSALALSLGFGRVPTLVWLATFLGTYGVVGLVLAPPLDAHFGALGRVVVHVAAPLVALVLTRIASRRIAGWLPSTESYASLAEDRIGRSGVVVVRLSDHEAEIRVRMQDGTHLRARAVSDEPMPGVGGSVVVVDHDRTRHRDLVCPLPPEAIVLPAELEKENLS